MSHVTGGGLLNVSRINQGFAYQMNSLAFKEQAPAFMREITARANTTDMAAIPGPLTWVLGWSVSPLPTRLMTSYKLLKDNRERRARTGYVKAGSGEVYLPDGSQV